jgi:hypothetical protein
MLSSDIWIIFVLILGLVYAIGGCVLMCKRMNSSGSLVFGDYAASTRTEQALERNVKAWEDLEKGFASAEDL